MTLLSSHRMREHGKQSANRSSQRAPEDSRICRVCDITNVRKSQATRREQSVEEATSVPEPAANMNGTTLCGLFFDNHDSERMELARALHDSTGQLLLTLSLNLARVRMINHDSHLDVLVDEMSETVEQIHREIRDFAFLEYPAELSASGLAVALRAFIRGFAKRTGLSADFHSRDVGEIENARAALAILRIAQEALVNAYRHAHPSAIHVTLIRNSSKLRLTVTDNGIGLPAAADKGRRRGVGLLAMRQRAEQVRGSLTITRLGSGTKLVAEIPAQPELD